MKSKKNKLSKILSGISGEYFVAAELSRHGLIAAVTLRNTPGADLLVSRPRGKKPATIQVKTIQDVGTPRLLNMSDERPKGGRHFYVFVTLNGPGGHPLYHVVEGNKVAKECAENHRKWVRGKKRDGGKRKDSSIRTFDPGERFLNGWDRICAN
jgi:hypothetical protein